MMRLPLVSLRRCRRRDLEKVAELEASCFSRTSVLPIFSFVQYYDLFSELFFVATHRGKVIGFIIGGITTRNRREAWLIDMVVAKTFQRQGVGLKLCQVLMKSLRKKGTRFVWATCVPANKASRGLLEKTGFRVVRRIQRYFGPGENRLLLKGK